MPENVETGVASSIPGDIRESVAIANVKTLADGPAFFTNLAMANAVQAQQQLSALGLTILAKATDIIAEKQIEEGGVLVAALQQMIKGAQTTPPVT
jgi:hypothetical protein